MASISKRASGAWQNTSYGIRGTATDTITTLPTTTYSDGTNATVSIKGNTTQSGTLTPDSPGMPEGCGDLETSGEKAGQYKIPISSANTTTPVYLGEVQSTRQIKKLVLTGGDEENWSAVTLSPNDCLFRLDLLNYPLSGVAPISTHYTGSTADLWVNVANNEVTTSIRSLHSVVIHHRGLSGVIDWKAYLATQYAAGTPVCVWYVLATKTTGIVNEPLMKIGVYADKVNNISIPTTDGANVLSVDTTVQPSEVSVNYHGWHMGTVHERTAGQWD